MEECLGSSAKVLVFPSPEDASIKDPRRDGRSRVDDGYATLPDAKEEDEDEERPLPPRLASWTPHGIHLHTAATTAAASEPWSSSDAAQRTPLSMDIWSHRSLNPPTPEDPPPLTVRVIRRLGEVISRGAAGIEDAGFLDLETICDFNQELIKPCCRKRNSKPVEDAPDPRAPETIEFIRWNVISFWLGIADLLISEIMSQQPPNLWVLSITLLDGQLGYFFAYAFYFIFIAHARNARWMRGGLAVILLYIITTALLTYEALEAASSRVETSEGISNGLKAAANCMLLYYAFVISRGAIEKAQTMEMIKASRPPVIVTPSRRRLRPSPS